MESASLSLAEALDGVCALTPAAVAAWVADEPVSYARMHARATRLASRLAATGLRPGDVLAVTSTDVWTIILLLHACARLDAVLFPLDPQLPAPLREGLCRQAGVTHLAGPDAGPLWSESRIEAFAFQVCPPVPARRPPPPGIALILATSGSTAGPKAVWLTGAALMANARAVNARLGLRPDDCWLACLPPYHIGGLAIALRCLLAGAAFRTQRFEPARVWSLLSAGSITHVSLVPAMLQRLLQAANGMPPAQLRVVLIGGAALAPVLAQRALAAGWPLYQSYGMTETASQLACSRIDAVAAPMLTLLDGVCCRTDALAAPDVAIRLSFRAPWLMSGYANPEACSGDGLDADGGFTSGDLGRIEGDRVQVLGRADEVLISGGENVLPQQVESLLGACAGVDQVSVIGQPDPVWGDLVCVMYSGSLGVTELEEWCRVHLGSIHRPRRFMRVAQLPQLGNGKIDRIAVRRLFADRIRGQSD